MKGSGHPGQVWRLVATSAVDGDKASLAVEGRLGYTGTAELEAALNDLLSKGIASVVLDLAGVDYLSSPGLRLLDRVSSDLEARGGTLSVVNVADAVRLALDLAGLARLSGSDAVKPVEEP